MLRARVAATVGALAVIACAPAKRSPPLAQPLAAAPPDYLAIGPRALLDALEPLVAYRRAQGHVVLLVATEDLARGPADPQAIYAAVQRVWAEGHGALHDLLLVGDAASDDDFGEAQPGAHSVPTFYLPKLDYDTHDHRRRHPEHGELYFSGAHDERRFPSDYPYALMGGGDFPPPAPVATLAVGRVPARTPAEVAGFAQKVIAYETRPVTSAWPRRLVVHAGEVKLGALVDRALTGAAMELLDDRVPYDYDLSIAFADPGSPYSYPPNLLSELLTEEADQGALLMAYVGHASPRAFDWVEFRGRAYPLGSVESFEQMRIAEGAPLFIALSCDVGAFDLRPGDRSIAEEAALNPFGPIAAFAASRVSHPYPNMLYGEAFIDEFLKHRPSTLGDGILAVKRDMMQRSSLLGEVLSGLDTSALKAEHEALYNLFGDPATVLRLPARAAIEVAPAGPLAVREQVSLTISAPVGPGVALVSLETRRHEIRAPLVAAERIARLPIEQAFAAMAENHERASDKAVLRFERPFAGGRATATMTLPDNPDEYVIKVLVRPDSGSAVAIGHSLVRVAAAD